MDGFAIREQETVKRRFSPPESPRTLTPPGSTPPTCTCTYDVNPPIMSQSLCCLLPGLSAGEPNAGLFQ